MSRIAWSVVVLTAALAACSGKSDKTAETTGADSTSASSSTTAPSSTTANSTSGTGSTGTATNTTGEPTASAKTADTSASPAVAVGGPMTTPAAAANGGAGTTTQGSSATTTASNTGGSTGTMGAAAGSTAHGQQVFSQTCVACHGAGVAGAPKVGDKADWGPRIAQGEQTLYQHAINGFQGKKGMMPPKGGNASLADGDVRAAVDYMVAQAR